MESSFYMRKLSTSLLLPLIFLLCPVIALSHSFSSSLQMRCHENERLALLQFKESFIVDNNYYDCFPKFESWKLLPGSKGGDCCSWDGVECDEETNHVISLDLSGSCLYGSIDSNSSLFLLVHLQRLNLAYNDFNLSQIPSEVSRFSSLTHLNLSDSNFTGQIPSQVFNLSRLISLDLSSISFNKPNLRDLSDASIYSTVPDILVNFSSLESLVLRLSKLKGEFPVGIFQLPKLKKLDLSHNSHLKGYLPVFQLGSPLQTLNLEFTNFVGELPSSIENLTYLEELYISGTNLTGRLPSSIGNLIHLKGFEIVSCKFTGQIPYSIRNLSNLISLYLSFTHFTLHNPTVSSFSWAGKLTKLNDLGLVGLNLSGEIPSWLMSLTQLSYLGLDSNQLTGPIPSSLANLTQLNSLSLSGNQLSGQIPIQIYTLTSLSSLDLSSNKLQGSIPHNISQLRNLDTLDLASNNFVGSLELSAIFQLKNLTTLVLSFNHLSLITKNNTNAIASLPTFDVLGFASCNLTEFPSFLQDQDRLRFLDLSSNNIQGQIPSWFGNISTNSLDFLNLSHNLLTGFEQDPVFLRWATLRLLDLRSNMLQGSLPVPPSSISSYLVSYNNLTGEIFPLICNLSFLETLDLSFNKLSGRLPHCLATSNNFLSLLDLRRNNFHGNIPSSWTYNCRLRMISISYNQLQGPVPRSLANCLHLELVDFGNNQLIDRFPLWLGSLAGLRILILRSNGFYGMIEKSQTMGFPNLQIIDLSHNNFTGKLSSIYFEKWDSMKFINASQMAYMGKSLLPGTWFPVYAYYGEFDYSVTLYNKGLQLEYKKIPDILTAIDFSYNKFQGEIPDIIGNLQALYLLNLSNNFLNGHIPSSLANLKALECLDLSNNRLSGEIPLKLPELIFLSSFNVSFNHRSGRIPQGRQFDTFENKSYEGNPGLCGAPLTRKCGNSEATQHEASNQSPFKLNWMIVMMGYGSGLLVGVVAGLEFTKRKHHWFVKTF